MRGRCRRAGESTVTALRLWTSVHGIAALNSTRAFEPITDRSAVTELTRRAVRDVIADASEPGT
ncbi:hypothetical protein CH251_18805 [Rhodococcus sp. 06-462-5]|nr:hypothetical protein CH251_18805 [Rhodococcus sp. 06-462-5]OZE69109.1 hypothetical protein CH270_05205 [Rhodococcus sp. 02-925g]